jgi:hypothetical protein
VKRRSTSLVVNGWVFKTWINVHGGQRVEHGSKGCALNLKNIFTKFVFVLSLQENVTIVCVLMVDLVPATLNPCVDVRQDSRGRDANMVSV